MTTRARQNRDEAREQITRDRKFAAAETSISSQNLMVLPKGKVIYNGHWDNQSSMGFIIGAYTQGYYDLGWKKSPLGLGFPVKKALVGVSLSAEFYTASSESELLDLV